MRNGKRCLLILTSVTRSEFPKFPKFLKRIIRNISELRNFWNFLFRTTLSTTIIVPFFSRIDAINTLITIRRAVNNNSFRDVKFSNSVGLNEEILRVTGSRELVKRFHICFYRNMSKFVSNLLGIDIFSHGLDVLRLFIRFIKGNPDLYRKFA